MRKVRLSEAKQNLSELVDRAERGERIGITRRGKLSAVIAPARSDAELREVFERIETIRKRVRKPVKLSFKDLIGEGRA